MGHFSQGKGNPSVCIYKYSKIIKLILILFLVVQHLLITKFNWTLGPALLHRHPIYILKISMILQSIDVPSLYSLNFIVVEDALDHAGKIMILDSQLYFFSVLD